MFLGYLSSPHVGQDPPYGRAQYSPVITSPVVPAVASGKMFSLAAILLTTLDILVFLCTPLYTLGSPYTGLLS